MSAAARARRPHALPFIDPPGYGRHRPEQTLLYNSSSSTIPHSVSCAPRPTGRCRISCSRRHRLCPARGFEIPHRSALGAILTCMMVEASEEFRRSYWIARFAQAATIIERGKARGEVRAQLDSTLLIELLVAPLYMRSLVTGEALHDDLPERLIGLVDI
jgi:hypothetical protein